MKLNKTLMAGAVALSLAEASNAGTVYMTGSTAMRGIVYTTIRSSGTVFTAIPTTTLFQGGGSSANYMAFSGTLVGGSGTTVIQCHWSGSEGGINDVASGATEQFIDPSLLDGTDHGSAVPGTTVGASANLAMADNKQSFSRTKSPTLTTGAEVGVITFTWVRNPGLWTGNNVTDSMIRQALQGGARRSVFTGASGQNDFVYVSGRDNQSGTRVNAFGVTGWGIFALPNQIEMDSSGNMVNLDGAGTYAGDYGFSSGGTLAGTLGGVTTNKTDQVNGGTGYSVIAYLSRGDANTAIGNGAVELTYNGITQSSANVIEGTHTFWGNEYIYQQNSAPTEAQTVYTKLVAGIPANCDGVKAIALTAMHCTRQGPTADPAHN
jgi:hypothetical protein